VWTVFASDWPAQWDDVAQNVKKKKKSYTRSRVELNIKT
jgi:hypothetical protein